MTNQNLAQLLEETADLLEIDGGDSFRIRSYRRAAEAVAQSTVAIASLVETPELLLARRAKEKARSRKR